jgi:hypothetical protein
VCQPVHEVVVRVGRVYLCVTYRCIRTHACTGLAEYTYA